MFRSNPIYDQLDFYYEVIKILEQLCDIDFRDPDRNLKRLKESWVVHEDARIGEVTPLKLASKTLNIPENALEAMLVHPDLPLVISELEAYTGINWAEQDDALPKQWQRIVPVSKWARTAEGDIPSHNILSSVTGHYHDPELSEAEWARHIENLFDAVKGAPPGSFTRPSYGEGPISPPSAVSSTPRPSSPESKRVITLKDAFSDDIYKPHGGWPEFIGKIFQEVENNTDTGGINVSYLVGFIEDYKYDGQAAFVPGLSIAEKNDAARQILRKYSQVRTRKATGEKIKYLNKEMREGDIWYTLTPEAKEKRWLVGPVGYTFSWRKNPQRYGKSLHNYILGNWKFLEKKGINLELPPLGEGVDGVVYYDASSTSLNENFDLIYKRVIKFTLSEEEIDTASWMTQISHPSLPQVFWTWGESWGQESWDIKDCPILFYGEPIYMFCREAIDDCVLSSESISLLQQISNTIIDIPLKKVKTTAQRLLEHKYPEIPHSERPLVEDFIDFIIWCARHGLVIADIHRKNLGQREDGTIVLRDFGHCKLY